jgi:hypothetical protein
MPSAGDAPVDLYIAAYNDPDAAERDLRLETSGVRFNVAARGALLEV